MWPPRAVQRYPRLKEGLISRAYRNLPETPALPHLPIIQTTRKTGVLDAAASVGQAGDWSVVGKALELVLHRLRQDRALDVRILRRFGREFGIEVGRVQSIGLSGIRSVKLFQGQEI